jgi:hypothetical protein
MLKILETSTKDCHGNIPCACRITNLHSVIWLLNANIISNQVEIASLQTSPWIQAAWIAIPHLEKIHIGLFWHSQFTLL